MRLRYCVLLTVCFAAGWSAVAGLLYGREYTLSVLLHRWACNQPAVPLIAGAVGVRLAAALAGDVDEMDFWLIVTLLAGLGHIFWPV